jgi:hypothetical protein
LDRGQLTSYDAVRVAVMQGWSNSPVEGQIDCPKNARVRCMVAPSRPARSTVPARRVIIESGQEPRCLIADLHARAFVHIVISCEGCCPPGSIFVPASSTLVSAVGTDPPVMLSLANHDASLPVAYELDLPEDWARDQVLRRKAKTPAAITFQAGDRPRADHSSPTPSNPNPDLQNF